MSLEITEANFEELVEKSDKPVLLDFWATWCGPCQQLGPVIEELAKDYEGKAVVAKCNIEHNASLVSKFGVRGVPTILFFKGGEVQDKIVGAAKKDQLSEKLEQLLK